MTGPETPSSPPTGIRSGIVMLLFVVVGAPMAYFVWHNLSDLLSGQVHGPSLAGAAVALVVLIGLLRVMARYLTNL